MTDHDYLNHLLETHLADQSPSTTLSRDHRRALRGRIKERRREQVTITREYANAGIDPSVLKAAIEGVTNDIEALEEQLARAEQWDAVRKMKADAIAALGALATRARENLAWPTPELLKEVFDLLDIRVLVGPGSLQLTGTIPIGAWDESDVAVGELRSGVPQDPLSNLPWSGMRVPFPISVELPVKWVAE